MPRNTCQECMRPLNLCYCHKVQSFQNKINIILLQHPLEIDHPFNTGRICELSFTNITTFKGEDFNEDSSLHKLIESNKVALLFHRPEFSVIAEKGDDYSHLIVIDANWKKAKKMYFLNTFLHYLPKVSLPLNLSSKYIVRKAPKEGHYSTIESIVYALNILEEGDYSKALDAFEYMNESQTKFLYKQKSVKE